MTTPTASQVLARRRAEQATLLAEAKRFAEDLDPTLGVRAVVVFGSVARGDFHDASDVDVLVIADDLPPEALERNAAVGLPPLRVEFTAWTPDEWGREVDRGNPIAVTTRDWRIVVRGDLDGLDESPGEG